MNKKKHKRPLRAAQSKENIFIEKKDGGLLTFAKSGDVVIYHASSIDEAERDLRGKEKIINGSELNEEQIKSVVKTLSKYF